MSTTVTLNLADLIDETLDLLYRPSERPRQIEVGSDSLTTKNDTTMTVTDANLVAVPSVVEFPRSHELVLVTSKSDDATPVLTVSRGYLGTPIQTSYPSGEKILIGAPLFPRYEVERAVRRAYATTLTSVLPPLETQALYRKAGLQLIELPADCLRVVGVRSYSTLTGRIVDVAGWRDEYGLPTTISSTGKALRVPSSIADDDELLVTFQKQYVWTNTGNETEDWTVDAPVGSEDLAPLWAAGFMQMAREVSRAELDQIEEWSQEQAIRAGVNLRLVRDIWGRFYSRLDEARTVYDVPKHRPYRKLPRIR